MAALQAPMASSINGERQIAKQLYANAMFLSARNSGFRRGSNNVRGAIKVRNRFLARKSNRIWCRFSAWNFGDEPTGNSGDGDGDGDGDYVNSTVIEAVEVKNGSDGFMIKMRDGKYLRCVYNHPEGGYPPDYISHPAIVLKLEDGSGIFLPIIVLEMPSALLMASLRNVEMARPTVYQVVTEMIETMGYMVKYVRVTERVQEAYFAELCVIKKDDVAECHCFDIRPSDAINIAVRCKAPIQVNKSLAQIDGLKIVEPGNSPFRSPLLDGSLLSEMDRPNGQPCLESEEFVLLRNMLLAAVEERYCDAAQWKDLLKQFRSRRPKWA